MAVVNEAVAGAAEQVAAEALEVADVARAFSAMSFGFGVVAGAVVAGGVTYLTLERKLRAKYEAQAEAEIAEMREHYRAKAIADQEKPDLQKVVEDLGYVPERSEMQDGTTLEPVEPGAPNVAPSPEALEETKNVFKEAEERTRVVDPDAGWDYDTERSNRTAGKPYVIHMDEQGEMQGFSDVTWTYYEGDDVLCDARDKIVDSRDEVLGTDFTDKFGHGSNDPNVVYIRNEELMVEIELCRSPNSYAEEVQGFRHSDENFARFPKRVTLDDE